ncbi:MAG: redoxin domain-containing protein [Cyclobacteriaceae bacterium]
MSMKVFIISLALFIGHGAMSQSVTPIGLKELENEMSQTSDELRVYNFWASWCGPCIQEMPHFDELSKDTNVTLVSLDFEEDLQKAANILNKKKISLSSYLLTEQDMDKYIAVLGESWSGAIPATVIISASGQRFFYEGSFDKEELFDLVSSMK